ncbi:relaxase/mobilization nuclease domain-containing protein [Flavobacterium macacae]|uniref:Relaxase n=1 Tax=Flavobacterium macacae TaxID=2488993 RepID=A0A3P3WAZ2_9FLAO|nr:relaxase/mobilization nuclease domain-containing protein [Flavobacterium macacae]RRJ90769.1 relaxase [Flavobacterium macacae]
MVAIINTGHSLRGIFNYNEKKVRSGQAECIGQGNYPADIEKMGPEMKLRRLTKQAELNQNVTRNSVHISLNFDTSETHISKEKLMAIADTYMEGIGFAKQPYLVYQHHDSGHPHIHIVSVKIGPDGKRIDMQNIGRNQSETARKEIEKSFGLVVAGDHHDRERYELSPIDSAVVKYGTRDTKRALSAVLRQVLPHYQYGSLAELNAVLNLYNVSATQGSEDSRIFRHNGIVYQVNGEDKKPVGVAVKASSFFMKPTMKYLARRFEEGRVSRTVHSKRIKNALDVQLLTPGTTNFPKMVASLKALGITVVERRNASGLLYGITYVDHTSKCVFNGSALGKKYSAKAIVQRCGEEAEMTGNRTLSRATAHGSKSTTPEGEKLKNQKESVPVAATIGPRIPPADLKILDALIDPEYDSEYLPRELKGRKKKKKKRGGMDGN